MDVSELARTADLPELGTAMFDLMGDLFPICRSITGAGLRETLARIGKVVPLGAHRGALRYDSLRLDRAEGVERPRRMGGRQHGPAGDRLPAVEPPRRELQRAGPSAPHPGRAPAPPPHAAGAPELGAVPDVLLRRQLGLLPQPGPARPAAGGRVRGGHRHDTRRRQPDVRRVRAARLVERRDPDLGPLLPSLPGQRQPLRRRRRRLPRSGPRSSRPSVHVSVPVRSRHDRGDRLVVSQRGPAGAHPGRHRAGLRR